MDNFKLASQQKLRVQTLRGSLSVEQLWDLSVEELDKLAVSLEEAHDNSKSKSFVKKRTTHDRTAKLRFDVVLDILTTKVEEANAATEAKEIKEHNTKILTLIAEKNDESLKGKSVKQLESMLK